MTIVGRWQLGLLVVCALAFGGCPDGIGISCPVGQTLCNTQCVFASSDAANCGGCGVVCPGELACINGSCGCPGHQIDCNNVCTDQQVDANNCGGCGIVCGPGLVCSQGSCEPTCAPNLAQCGQSCFDVKMDRNNC